MCLVFNGTSTQDRSICANCGRVKPTQLAKDGQRDTVHNSQYVTQCNTVHNKTEESQSEMYPYYKNIEDYRSKLNKWLNNVDTVSCFVLMQ